MNICLVGSILRHTVHSDAGVYSGWGGMTESAIAPFASLLDKNSKIYFVGSVGKEDLEEVKEFFRNNYPLVDTSGIHINPTGTDHHEGDKHFVKVKIKVEPTQYKDVEPYIHKVDVVIFNFGNIDDIDPEAIIKVKQNSKALVYVDVHRKPYGVDQDGHIYSRGWPNWEEHLGYADVVQMNRNECGALFQENVSSISDFVDCARKVLDAGAGKALITLGDKGVLAAQCLAPNQYQYALTPAITCRVVDTTGCGDSFAAGYLVGTYENKPFSEAIKLGSLMAAINCEFVGYIKGINRKKIEERKPLGFNLSRLDFS